MALTQQQKAENRAANGVRDRAYGARLAAYRAERASIDSNPVIAALKKKGRALDQLLDEQIEQRNDAVAALKRQISELTDRIAEVQAEAESAISATRAQRRVVWDQWIEARRAEERKVEARFSDLSGAASLSVTAWRIPETVQAAMDAARRAVDGE